jgi:Ca2+-binding EF-hand superfamily protein
VLSQADRGNRDRNTASGNRFRGMDRNADGMITRSEWRGNDTSFRQHDRNNDGVLSGSEMRGTR